MAGTFVPRRGLGAIVAVFVLLVSCSDSPTEAGENPPPGPPAAVKPTVSTAAVTGVTITTATAGGDVTADGGSPVTARGVVWSVLPDPTVSDDHTTDGTGNGSFVSEIAGLSPEGTYYVRAYATNSAGTAYGDQVSFTTDEGTYAIIVLGQVDGLDTRPRALDEDCRIAGSYNWGGDRWTGFLWEPGTGFRSIDLGYSSFWFLAMNAGGTVAGIFEAHDIQRRRAFTWSESDGVRFYDPPAGSDFVVTSAWGINNHGVVAGDSYVGGSGGGTAAATLWGPNGETVLPDNRGFAVAQAINDAGVVAGSVGTWNQLPVQAVVWLAPDQEPVVLPGATSSYAEAINNHGDVAGRIDTGRQAVLWRDGQAIVLEAPSGYTSARADVLTEPDAQGVVRVVGSIAQASHDPHRPVIWTLDGTDVQMEELYPPAGDSWASPSAVMIRDGEVVVVGHSASGYAVLWTTSREVCGL
jgi:hypothetical protein